MAGLGPRHPSNRLYSNDVSGFDEAMQLVEQECDWEIAQSVSISVGVQNPDIVKQLAEDGKAIRATLADFKQKARRALDEYRRGGRTVSEFLAWLRSHDDHDMRQFADALEAGDYSGLAI